MLLDAFFTEKFNSFHVDQQVKESKFTPKWKKSRQVYLKEVPPNLHKKKKNQIHFIKKSWTRSSLRFPFNQVFYDFLRIYWRLGKIFRRYLKY